MKKVINHLQAQWLLYVLPGLFFCGATAFPYRGFEIKLRHTTVGMTPLDEWSARRRDLYLTTNNTHKRQTSMTPAGFESTIPAREWPQNRASNCTATGIGHYQV